MSVKPKPVDILICVRACTKTCPSNLGCEDLVKVGGKFFGDFRVYQASEPINNVVAETSLVELFRGGGAEEVVIPPLFFKPSLMIAIDIRKRSLALSSSGRRGGNNTIRVIILIAEIDSHLRVAKVSRD